MAPYRRVVGIEVMGEATWAISGPDQAEGDHYEPAEAAPLALDASPLFGARLAAFFKRYLAAERKSQADYNCHRFAHWMGGIEGSDVFRLLSPPDHILKQGHEVEGSLPLGAHGVIGSRVHTHGDYHGLAKHSVVGLGEDNPDCIQVTALGGYLAIASYQDVLGEYNKHYSVANINRLFALPA